MFPAVYFEPTADIVAPVILLPLLLVTVTVAPVPDPFVLVAKAAVVPLAVTVGAPAETKRATIH